MLGIGLLHVDRLLLLLLLPVVLLLGGGLLLLLLLVMVRGRGGRVGWVRRQCHQR